jgi:hypothetical protein
MDEEPCRDQLNEMITKRSQRRMPGDTVYPIIIHTALYGDGNGTPVLSGFFGKQRQYFIELKLYSYHW